MRFLFFGVSITSAWANGHALVYRGLARALASLGHEVDFVEWEDAGRAAVRDLVEPPYARVESCADWEAFRPQAAALLSRADVTIVGCGLEDGIAVAEYVLAKAPGRTVLYDHAPALTIDALDASGGPADGRAAFIRADQIRRFDLVCAAGLGPSIGMLTERYGARAVGLLGAAEEDGERFEGTPRREYRSDLSFLGGFGHDRAETLERLLVEPARRRPEGRFVVAGPGFADGGLPPGAIYFPYVAPAERAEFDGAAGCVLNAARHGGHEASCSPPARLFEAAAAGACVVSEPFPGLESLFRPGEEVLIASTTEEVLAALDLPAEERAAIGLRARYRCLKEHTYAQRARELLRHLAEI